MPVFWIQRPIGNSLRLRYDKNLRTLPAEALKSIMPPRLQPQMKQLYRTIRSTPPLYSLPDCWAGPSIPNIIHQTCNHKEDLEDDIKSNIQYMRSQNPNWTYFLYDDKDRTLFIKENYSKDIFDAYNKVSDYYGAAKADFFRYLVIYKIGGVYLDLKSRIVPPLDELVRADDSYLLAQWQNGPSQEHIGFGIWPELGNAAGGEFQQWHIIASPGHPFLKAVIEAVLNNINCYNPWLHGTGRRGVLRLTGPIAYTRAIVPIQYNHPHRRIDEHEAKYFIYSIIDNQTRLRVSLNHYTRRTDTIIKFHGLRAISAMLYSLLKKLWRLFNG